jgi:hypothetical protein
MASVAALVWIEFLFPTFLRKKNVFSFQYRLKHWTLESFGVTWNNQGVCCGAVAHQRQLSPTLRRKVQMLIKATRK